MSSALYRKYRPAAFDGVIGQEHIVQTLINQIKTNRVCHAYLFCGSRGVGKTSLARIFARAVNCSNQDQSSSMPCGKCDFCRSSMSADSSMDIIEIDAASNNGVDDARELRETVKYLPVKGKYKVYIIDEVHMLSTSAFNALLKTLEEPPEHAVFILATTEAHKLPATVLSRCVRFDFRLVAATTLYKLLSKIFAAEGKDFEEDALRAIASAAEGSVRDALSIADMCINLSAGTLTAREVKELIGGEDEKIESLLLSINRCDVKGALTALKDMANGGMGMTVCCKQLAATARDIMAVKLDENLLDTTLSRHNRLKTMSVDFSVSFLASVIELFINAESNLRYALSPLLSMEAAVIRACRLYSLDLNAIDERLNRCERSMAGVGQKTSIQVEQPRQSQADLPQPPPLTEFPQPLPAAPADRQEIPQPPPINQQETPINQSPAEPVKPKVEITAMKLWGKLITFFRKNSTPKMFGAISAQDPQKVSLKDNVLTVSANKDNFLFFCDDAFKEEMDRAFLSEGHSFKLAIEKDLSAVDMEKEVESMLNEFGKQKVNIIS